MRNGPSIALLSGLESVTDAGAYGLMFQCAPDGSARKRWQHVIAVEDLVGEFDDVKRKAASLAHTLLKDEPPIRGVQQLRIFEELVIRELQQIVHAQKVHDVLRSRGFRRCTISPEAPLAGHLASVGRAFGNELEVELLPAASRPTVRGGGLRRSLGRIAASGLDRKVLAGEWHQVLERVDPYHARSRRRGSTGKRGGTWFYSTAQTYTAMGLLYEPWFPEGFQFLVENPLTGGLPLRSRQRPFHSPYEHGRAGMRPGSRETTAAANTIAEHLRGVHLDETDRTLVRVYLQSPAFAQFASRLLPKGLFQSALFARFVHQVAPACVVVGNPVFEGYLLHAARAAGVPSIILQHGILGDFCQFIDPPADHYIVRGQFWREFLAPAAARRAQVLNPRQTHSDASSSGSGRDRIVFLTAPYSHIRFSDEGDLHDILGSLLQACREQGAPLTIRVHPLEQVGYYRRLLERMPDATQCAVDFSQGGDLQELLSQAAAAVTFCSTAFLDCLRLRVPVISFGWHDFSFKRQIETRQVFHFAPSLDGLRRLVQRALQGELPAFNGATQPFLDATPEDKLRSAIAGMAAGVP